jgi:LysR family transcriptional regulator, transcriptional activator of the cysJI operon
MELEARLRAFAAFARQRSFSAAASELRISQPAVSKHVADLERIVGLKLVERSRRGALTNAGDFLANHVLRAQSLLAQAALGIAQFRERGIGSLSIVATWLTGTFLLSEIIADFRHSHPAIRLALRLGTTAQAMELLRSHEAELGFVAGAIAAPEIETEPLLEYEVVVVARPGLLPQRPTRESLESATWLSREEGSATRALSDTAMARLGIVPRTRLELPSYEAVVYALKSGYGICAISRYVVAEELRAKSLAVVPIRGWDVRQTVSLLRVRDAVSTPAAILFQNFVRSRFKEAVRQRARRKRTQ